jgi:hypothetical protein
MPDDNPIPLSCAEQAHDALREARQVLRTVSIAQSVKTKLLIQISDRYACLAAIEKGLPGWPAIKDQE